MSGEPTNTFLQNRARQLTGLALWVLLLLVLAVAAGVRTAIPAIPLAEYDTWGWLGAAMNGVGGKGFHEVFEREWLYGAFLAGIVYLTGTFSAVVVIQQSLGLIGGGLAFLTWRTWTGLLRVPLWAEALISLFGLGVITMNLFDTHLLALEISLRPEGILIPIAFAQLASITLFSHFWWQTRQRRIAIVFGAIAVPLAYILYVLKPNWALAVPLTLLPLGLALVDNRRLNLSALLAPAVGALLMVGAVWLPGKLLFLSSPEKRMVLPMTLLTIHGDIVLESLKSHPRPELPEGTVSRLEQELEIARADNPVYHRLGFDPDYLMYRASLFPWLETTHGFGREELAAFCVGSYLQAWKTHPTAMLRKIFVQFDYLLRPDPTTFSRQKLALSKLYDHSSEIYPTPLDESFGSAARNPFAQWKDDLKNASDSDVVLRTPKSFLAIRRACAPLAPWLLAVFLCGFAYALVKHAPERLAGFLALTFWFAPAGNALTVAVAHALDNSRYRTSYGGLLFFALAAMTAFLVVVVSRAFLVRFKK